MRRTRGWRRRGALLAACAVSAIGAGTSRRAEGAPVAVALLAQPGTRLADELARELEVSGFGVVRVEATTLSAAPAQALRGVLVSSDDRRVTVFARFAPSGELGTRIELQVDPRDRLVRRRVCLTVVEYLRLLSSGEASPEPPPDPPASRPAPLVRVEQLDGELAATAVLSEKAAQGVPVSPGRPWVMGVAATLDLDTALGESTGHLLFIWHFPVGPRLGVRALGFWPLFGAELQRGDEHVRLWTFGTAVGLQYAFVESPAVVRPFVGATLGMRLTLTEATTVATSANDATTFTPSANAGLQAGLAFQLSRVVQLFLESGATRDWRIPGVSAGGVAASASNAFSLNSSIGAMFEY